jgi:hypothetical protein
LITEERDRRLASSDKADQELDRLLERLTEQNAKDDGRKQHTDADSRTQQEVVRLRILLDRCRYHYEHAARLERTIQDLVEDNLRKGDRAWEQSLVLREKLGKKGAIL